jgi:hypothetical protein
MGRFTVMDKGVDTRGIDATADECRINAVRLQKHTAAADPESKSKDERLAREWLRKATELENDLA